MAKIKIGIIGCGTIANSAHIPAYMNNADVEIKYFCDIMPEKAKAAVEKYGCGIAVDGLSRRHRRPGSRGGFGLHPQQHALHHRHRLRCAPASTCCARSRPPAPMPKRCEMQKAQHETGKVLNIGVVNRFNDRGQQACKRA